MRVWQIRFCQCKFLYVNWCVYIALFAYYSINKWLFIVAKSVGFELYYFAFEFLTIIKYYKLIMLLRALQVLIQNLI